MLETIVTVVTNSYLETAVWSSNDWSDFDDDCDNPRPLDENYDSDDFTGKARAAAESDCRRFLDLLESTPCDGYDNLYDAAESVIGDDHIGHDFWLTRNGHGAGFWDGDYADFGDAICDVLYAEFGRYAELNIFVDSDGQLEFE